MSVQTASKDGEIIQKFGKVFVIQGQARRTINNTGQQHSMMNPYSSVV